MALWFETALVDGAWRERVRIVHKGGLITEVAIGAAPDPDDERGAVAIPGLGNVHSHAFQRGMAGLAETRGPAGDGGDSFWTWREVMYRFVAHMGPRDLQAIAAMAYAEMLEAGFTRVGEFHYVHHAPDGTAYEDPGEMAHGLAAAANDSGIGLTLLPVFYAHGGFGGAEASPRQRRFLSSPDSYGRLIEASRSAVSGLEDAVVGLAPHSLRAATPEEIAAILPLEPGGPWHIHIAEQALEAADCQAAHGATPVAWFADQISLDSRWVLIHATHVTDRERVLVAASGAVAGLCPITEANLGDGVFPSAAFLAEGGRLAIGSDSNVLIDVAEELRTLEYGQRLTRQARNLLTSSSRPSVGGTLFAEALAGGAQALGVTPPRLATGESLDLVSLDREHPALLSRAGDALLDGWIFAARRGAVDCVWRRGRKVVSSGRHVGRTAILAAYRRALGQLLAA